MKTNTRCLRPVDRPCFCSVAAAQPFSDQFNHRTLIALYTNQTEVHILRGTLKVLCVEQPTDVKAKTSARAVYEVVVKKLKLETWANAQRDGRPTAYRWRPLFNAAVWLTPTTRVPCSNAAKTRNPLKLAGLPQTNETI